MRKIYNLFILSLLISGPSFAQTELQKLNDKAKNIYLKPEEVDQLVLELKKHSGSVPDSIQRSLLFDTYQLVASRYAGSNHFKQAYYLYHNYLELKEKALAKEKARLIALNVASNKERETEMITGVKKLKDNIAILESNEQQLAERKSGLIRNTLLLVVIFSGIFTAIFVRFSVQLKRLKNEINQYKKQLMAIEKSALIGRLKESVTTNNQKQLEVTRVEVSSLQKLLKQLEPAVGKEIMVDFKKTKDSFLKAETDLKVLARE